MTIPNTTRRLFLASLATARLQLRSNPTPSKHLFLDSRIVESRKDLTLRVGTVAKDPANPLFAEDKPWEVRYDNVYANVIHDEKAGIFRCWYSPFIVDPAVSETPRSEWATKPYQPRRREMGVCYAESKDGLRWTKPELGLVDFEGSKQNNLVMRGPHGAGVVFDPHDPDPQRRFKMFFQHRGVSGAFSSDGIHWSKEVNFPGINAPADTHNFAQWIPKLNKYVGITRLRNKATDQRIVARTESTDFLNWTKAEEVMQAVTGSPLNQTYAMPFFEYEGIYIGLVMIFNTATDTVWCELAWSPDTLTWERVDVDHPLIPLGDGKSYDSGCIYAAANPIVTKDGILMYYGSSNGPHTGWRDGFFCLSRLRSDGFAGLAANKVKGTVVTKPVEITSADLSLNVEAPNGLVRVGVLQSETCSLENSIPIKGDHLSATCAWTGANLSPLVGKKVQLVFEMQSAKAYSFQFV